MVKGEKNGKYELESFKFKALEALIISERQFKLIEGKVDFFIFLCFSDCWFLYF